VARKKESVSDDMEQKTTKESIIRGLDNWIKNHKGEMLFLHYDSVIELRDRIVEMDNEIKALREQLDK
jgi:hypothetical protein